MGGPRGEVVQLATCWLVALVVLVRATEAVGGRAREISVPRGFTTFLRPADLELDLRPDPNTICVVSVVPDDPGSQRVGRLHPEIFDCDFGPEVVRYEHNGNPTLDVDRVRLVVRQAASLDTRVDEIILTVRITAPAGLVFVHKSSFDLSSSSHPPSYLPPSELTVDVAKSPLSTPIDAAVLRFRYDFVGGDVCTLVYADRQPVHFRSQSFASGGLVSADGSPVVGNLSIDCRDFIASGYRYRHRQRATNDSDTSSSSSSSFFDVDYVPLTAEVQTFVDHNITTTTTTSGNATATRRPMIIETIFLPVRISGGVGNTAPEIRTRRGDDGTSPIIWIDQFSTLTLTGELLSAVDDETPADDIVFTVTLPPPNNDDGFFVDVRRNAWKSIRSFRQGDVVDGRIAFQTASRQPAPDRIVDVELTATDGRFASSRPFRFRIGVRRVDPASPKVVRNTELVIGHGQSRRIGINNLRIYDASGRSDWIQIHVLRGGPRRGTLKVRGRVTDAFNASDLERGEVVYEHDVAAGGIDDDDGEPDVDDSILIRISNFKYSTRTRFSIRIIRSVGRKHRRQRFAGVGTNVATEVRQNGYAQITTLHLDVVGSVGRASFVTAGTAADDFDAVVYEVVTPPRHGQILTMFRPMTRGRRTSTFTQQDLDRGHIWYRHTASGGGGNTQLSMSAAAAPATRDHFRFVLRSAGSRVRQTLTDDNDEGPEVVLQHDIIVRPHAVDLAPRPSVNSTRATTALTTATLVSIGRDTLSYIDLENPSDDVLYVVTCQPYFVRRPAAADDDDADHLVTVDAGQIVYYDKTAAAASAAGTRSSPSSSSRNDSAPADTAWTLPITVFPPLRTFTQSMVDADLVSYLLPMSTSLADQRVPIDVRFVFSVSDLHGNFVVDQTFDIRLLPAVTSGISSTSLSLTSKPPIASAARRLRVEDSSDQSDGRVLSSVHVIDVDEGEQVVIGVGDVADRSDSSDDGRVFEIVKSPIDGVVLIDGHESKSFTMADLRRRLVRYRHTGGETGQTRRTDSVTFSSVSVNDDEDDGTTTRLIDVEFVIRPVDNSAPELTVGALVVIDDGQLAVPLTADIVSASDVDTDPDRLTFVVVETPSFGRLDLSRTRGAGRGPATVASRRGRSSGERRGGGGRGGAGGGSSKRAVTAFSMSDLRNGAVRYVRRSNTTSSASPSSPLPSALFDSFKVYASDGQRHSAVGQIEIALGGRRRPLPTSPGLDEQSAAPLDFDVEDRIDVEEGGYRVIDVRPKNFTSSAAASLSTAAADPMLSLVLPPRHGNVLLSIRTGSEVSEVRLESIAASDLSNPDVQLVYRHDGRPSSSTTDQFSLSMSDGYRRSSVKTVIVNVSRPNLLPPSLSATSKLIIRGPGGRTTLTPTHLRGEDADSTADKIRYVVVAPPAKGRLERLTNSSSSTAPMEIEEGDTFTQLDVDAGRIIYVASGTTEVPSKDGVTFRMSDGKNVSPQTEFLDIEIVAAGSSSSSSATSSSAEDTKDRRISVVDGFGISLSVGVLGGPSSESSSGAAVQYRIVTPPRRGQICLQYNESASLRGVTQFSRLDVEAGRVYYRLQKTTDTTADGPDFTEYRLENADNRVSLSAVRRLLIDIDNEDASDDDDDNDEVMSAAPPTLTLDVNVPLTVIHGYRATLSAANLHISVSGQSRRVPSMTSRLVFTVVEPPKHGQIVRSPTAVQSDARPSPGGGAGIRSFTQSDVDAGLIEYKSDSSDESMMDYFLFSVGVEPSSSSRTSGPDATTGGGEQKPLFFSILIQPVTKIPPKVIRRQSPERLMRLDDQRAPAAAAAATGSKTTPSAASGTRFGFVFSGDNLKAVHPLFDGRDVVYQLKTRPQHGYLEHLGSRRQIRRKFTQRDVDERRIAFVLNDRTRATNDSFTYRIVDLNRNTVDDQRMQLHWSIIQFTQSQYIVCEDAQLLAVSIVRTGYINQSATVNVRLKSLTAKETTDFRNKSAAAVEFLPGVSEVKWLVEIVNDGLHEGNDEKFKILLENTTNAILGQLDKTQVHLVDFEHGECMEYIGMITKNNADGAPVTVHSRQPKNNHRHRPAGFNRQTNAFRPRSDDLPTNVKQSEDEDDDDEDSLTDADDDDEYEDYLDNTDEDSASSLLSSDLAFYMPPDSASTSQTGGEGAGAAVVNRRNKNADKSRTADSNAKRTKGSQSPETKLTIPQPCSRETQGLLFFDLQSSKMYRCTGQRWEHWGWGLTGATEAPPSPPPAGRKSSVRRRHQVGSRTGSAGRGEVRTPRHNVGDASRDACPTNWTLDGSTCYLLIDERITWNEAERSCQSNGGHVTGVQSWQDLNRLWRLVGQRPFWIGIYSEPAQQTHSDDVICGRWTNADGSRPAYFNWRGNTAGQSSDDEEDSATCDSARPKCVAVIGQSLRYVSRPCDGTQRLRAVCAARPQQLVTSSKSPARRRAPRRRTTA